jgi:transposase-like protein
MGKITGKSQKGQNVPDWDEDQARDYFEARRWPNGPACVHCGSIDVYRVGGTTGRPGLLECRDCRKQFSVTVGTVMEDTHLPLSVWAKAFHYIASSKKGFSALQLQRNCGIGSYRTAWFLAHRIREAMRCEPVASLLKGDVQVDEAYIGPSRHGKRRRPGAEKLKRGRGTKKHPVLVLVETNGNAHSQPIEHVNAKTLKAAMRERIDPSATIVTDELGSYPPAAADFAGHQTVCHSKDEYVNADGYTTNTAESYIALMKRGVYGVFHHVSKKHLHRYCDEFNFRWNGRKLEDSERRDEAVRGAEGKRLYYRTPTMPSEDTEN